jgi:protein-tyrosine-phosphatase
MSAPATTATLQKTVLFLCTGNYYRSRFAEILFDVVALRSTILRKRISSSR